VYLFDLPAAAFLSVIQLVFTGLLLLGYTRLQAAMSLTLRLAPASLAARRPRGVGQWSLVLVFGVGVTAALIVPLVLLAAASFGAPGGFDVDSWLALFRNTTRSLFWTPPSVAAGNSLLFSACAILLSLLVGIPAAFVLSRPRGGPTGVRTLPFDLLELLFLLPLGASAVTLGFGFIVSLDRPPIDLRASLLLVPIAHALVALPLVTRSVAAPLASLDPRLREAAAVLGAGPARARWEIDLPILRRALLGAAAFAFTVSLGEFAATALLARPEFTTLPLAIYRFLQRPGELNRGQAFAMSTLLMAACAAGIAAIERTRSRGTEAF
jgi:thiamine transport system permease protein